MAQGNYGTAGNPLADLHSEQIQLTGVTSDPTSPTEGDMWLRTDLASGDKIATVRFEHGSGTWDIPVFAATESVPTQLKKVLGVQTPNGEGFIPLYEGGGAFKQLGFQHDGVRHGVHDSLTAIPDSGVLRWGFNEGSGTTATDAWGSNDGTISGAAYTTDSAEGSHALSFDATDGDVIGSATGESTDGISFAIWFRSSNTADSMAAVKHETSGDSYVRLEGNITTGEMGIRFYDGSNTGLVETTSGILDGTYHHAVGTRASDGTVELYIDGSSVGTDASSTSAVTLDGNFKVGQNEDNWWWDGELDDPRVYNKVLTSTEVSNLTSGSISG